MKKILLPFFIIIISLTSTVAQTWTWTGAGDGTTWQDATNWDKGTVPPVDSFATFIGMDTITGTPASIMKISTGENGHVILNLDLTIGDGNTAEHNIIANTNSTLTLGTGHTFTVLGEKSKNGVSTFAATENASIIIEEGAVLTIDGCNNGVNYASGSSSLINHGKLLISDSKNSINIKDGALFWNADTIRITNPGGKVTRGVISTGKFVNDTSGYLSVITPDKDCIELKGDTMINHGLIEVRIKDDAGSGDNGIAVGTSSDAAVLINTGKNSIHADGGAGVDGRAIYVYEAGKLQNSGRIEVTGGNDGSRFYTRGESINDIGGIIDLLDGRMNVNDGSFTNNGLILSSRQGSAIFNVATATNNAFYQYDSMRVFAIGSGTFEDNGIDLRNPNKTTFDFMGGITQDIAEVSYNYYEGETFVGSSDASGVLTIIPSALSGDPAVIYPEGLPQAEFVITNFEMNCDETINTEASICQGESFEFMGQSLTSAGVYRDTTENDGCEIITVLTLSILDLPFSSAVIEICQGDSFDFNGNLLTASGIYRDTIAGAGANGCDSLLTLTLSVLNNEFENLDTSICAGETIIFADRVITESGVYSDTTMAPNGCLNITNLTVAVMPLTFTEITDSICGGDSYNFNGIELTGEGIYVDTITGDAMCAEIISLTLTVLDNELESLEVTICPGETYDFNGETLTEEGVYIDTVAAANGCVRIETLTLTVAQDSETRVEESICSGETFNFNGRILSEAGEYRDTIESDMGCRRIEILTLIVNQVSMGVVTVEICSGEVYDFNGALITDAGQYADTLTNVDGCDSFIMLVLTVLDSESDTETVSICSGETYDFNGVEISESGTYLDTLTSTNGCARFETLILHVLSANTIELVDTICTDQPDTILFNGQEIIEPGIYTAELTNASGCDSLVTLTVMGVDCISSVEDDIAASFLIYPNPARDLIVVQSEGDFELEGGAIINAQGHLIKKVILRSPKVNNRIEINLEEVPEGIYFIRLQTDQGYALKRLIKI